MAEPRWLYFRFLVRILTLLGLLVLEVLQIHLIFSVLWCFLVLGQVAVVLLLGSVGLALVSLLVMGWKALPVLADQLGNFGKGQVVALEVVPHFIGKEHVGRWWPLRCILIRLWVPAIFALDGGGSICTGLAPVACRP